MGYKRKRYEKRKLKKLYDETKHSYGAGAYYDEDKKRYIRYSAFKSTTAKFFRKVSNRKVRKTTDSYNHGSYKKIFDYWWNLF